ncbi:hypothetical protein [Arthrobacter sp. IK3]|uniref:hypothetical protein n=1 Tax=Arthrobacter sp. IK3 TaxID=3448169 RepID=UPI003EE0BFB9
MNTRSKHNQSSSQRYTRRHADPEVIIETTGSVLADETRSNRHGPHLKALEAAGLSGTVTLHRDDTQDVTEDTLRYTNTDGDQVLLSGIGTDRLTVRCFTPPATYAFTHPLTAAQAVTAVEYAIWQTYVQPAFAEHLTGTGYAILSCDLGRGNGGHPCASVTAASAAGTQVRVTHDYSTGETLAGIEDRTARGQIRGIDPEAFMEELTGSRTPSAEVFRRVLQSAGSPVVADRFMNISAWAV